MRKQVSREWLWAAILLIVILGTAFLLGSCADTTPEVNRGIEVKIEPVKPKDEPFARQLDWGLYIFEYEGHTYFWELDGFLLHVASCKGDHGGSTGPYIRTGR